MRNLKKVIALIAVFAMMVSTVAFAATFGDVKEGDNYYEAIETLNKLGILTGDDENNDGVMEYRPNDSITRAEITVIVARIQGQTGAVAQADTVFTDVPSTYWASGYIASATNQGIINGYGDGTFGPDDKVLYEDVIKMLMETLGYKPYAQNNGGYPTGYILAAQRQSVLKNVVGGAEGTEATRGQVAQMTYNAIDTPLMERYVYGGEAQYVIWDGESWSPRKTLMNQALGINKLKGVVTENEVTALDAAVQIDTDATQQIKLYVEDNYLGSNDTNSDYEVDSVYPFYTGDTNAADYLGYDVVLYAQDNKNETDTILSITEATGKNSKVEFTLDKFNSYDADTNNLSYMKNDTDKSATKLKLQTTSNRVNYSDSPAIIYNGIAYSGTLESLFGSYEGDESGLIYKDSAYSGKVTVLDNDDTSGYDVIFVDVAVGAVVDELSSRGVLTFKNSVGDRNHMNSVSKVEFDSSNTDMYINLTKDGKPYDYTALKAWDVLSIVANNGDAQSDYYDIKVLDNTNTAITGSVSRTSSSDTSADGTAYTISGVDYDLAEGYYNNGTLKAGSEGTFYIDEYGKIVAYNKDSNSKTSDNYGYVIDAQITSSGFSDNVPSLRIIYKDGTIGTYDFQGTVTIDNPTEEIQKLVGDNSDSVSFKYKDYSVDAMTEAINTMAGTVITYNATNGYIKSITMAALNSTTDDSTLVLEKADTANVSSFDEDTKQIRVGGTKKYDVADDTLIFYIGKPGDSFVYNKPAAGEPSENCIVGQGSELRTNDNFSSAVYRNGDESGTASVIVMYNTDPGVGASTGVAYITSIGQTTVDGSKVLSITYYQDGELKEANTDDMSVGDYLDQNTVAGSLFKFGISNGTITSAVPYLTFDGTVRDKVYEGDDFTTAGIPNANYVKTTGSNSDEEVYYGAVVQKSGNRLTIAQADADGIISLDPNDWESVSLSNYTANYYLYDPTRNGKAKFQTASLGDITVDKVLANDGGNGSYTIDFGGVVEDAPAFGMLDFVYVRTYERTADVVDYTTWEYDYNFSK